MLYSAKHPHEGKARRQVYVEAHHKEVQGRESRGPRNFEWNTDLIETKKLENYTCQVAQCTVERRNTNLEEHNTADLFTKHSEGLRTQSLARKREPRILDGTIGDH